jgi:4-amino-4-deoxychorismate lyase
MKQTSTFEVIRIPSLNNRALNYGDGCFTTMLCRKGRVELLELHVARLFHDARKLGIIDDSQSYDPVELSSIIRNLVHQDYFKDNKGNDTDWQVCKIVLTRGDSERGYSPSTERKVLLIPSIHKRGAVVTKAIKLGVANMTLSQQPMLAGLKHLNRLEQVMAKIELAKHTDTDDLILTTLSGTLVELTASNLFYYIDGQWHTPSLHDAGVKGVMRQFILAHLQQVGLECNVCEMNISVLAQATAAFSCNALSKIVPVSHIYLNGEEVCLNVDMVEVLASTINKTIEAREE